MNKLKIFVCGFLDEHMEQIPNAPHIVKVNLSKLDLGEFQTDQLCEHRIYLTDLVEKADAEYVGFVTWRWFQKWGNLIPLDRMNELTLKPNRVYGAGCHSWLKHTLTYHNGMAKYLEELSEHTKLPLTDELFSFGANQFICHKSVYLEWQKFFRDVLNYFHGKYQFNFDFEIEEHNRPRQAGAFYERSSMLYFGSRTDLEIKSFPNRNERYSDLPEQIYDVLSKKIVFYTIISDSHYAGCRTDEFIESFKLFHPDIDLVVFREKAIRKTFEKYPGMTFMNAKAIFAIQLYDEYDIVVNIDADHLIFDRMTEILTGDYEVAGTVAQSNFLNGAITVASYMPSPKEIGPIREQYWVVPEDKYLEAGLIAARRNFWDAYHWNNLKHINTCYFKEQDIYNLVLAFVPLKTKILDGDSVNGPQHKCWYGTSSMGREHDVVICDNNIMLHGKPMKTYHFSRFLNPKQHPKELFSSEVCNWIYSKIVTKRPLNCVKIVDGVYYY